VSPTRCKKKGRAFAPVLF